MKRQLAGFAVTALWGATAYAHSASDAYLTLSVDAGRKDKAQVLQGQWDIALRDLDFVLHLDDDGDGEISWGEFKHHQAAIQRYVFAKLEFKGSREKPCALKPTHTLIDGHADGAYAALFFEVRCAPAMPSLKMNYSLFFAIDPSHRGIFVERVGDQTSTAVLSPQNRTVPLL